MTFRMIQISLLAIGLAVPTVSAQVPIEFGALEPPAALSPALQRAVAAKAANYPFAGFRMLGRDSVLLVFEDSTLTVAGLRAHTWMFGPPVTTAEADSCPPEKVLGRKIARAFWNAAGRPSLKRQLARGVESVLFGALQARALSPSIIAVAYR